MLSYEMEAVAEGEKVIYRFSTRNAKLLLRFCFLLTSNVDSLFCFGSLFGNSYGNSYFFELRNQ